MRGTRKADVAQRRHVAEPREPTWTTWTPTWREESVGLSVCGPTSIVGPR